MKLSSCLNVFLGAALFLSDGANGRLSSSPKVENAMRKLKNKQRAKRDFMQAMAGDDAAKARKLHAPTKLSQAERYERFVNKLKKSSTPRKLQDNNGYYQYNNQGQYNQNQQGQDGNGQDQQGQQNGQYNQNYQGQQNGQYNQNYQGQQDGQYDQNGQYQGEGDMEGQYYNYQNNGYQNDYGGYDMYEEYNAGDVGFAMENYAFKYAGCAAIKSYDEGNAYEGGDAMATETYVVFRLCPQDKCNKYSMTGCGKNYGEYLIEMEVYLEAIMEYYDAKYEDYCEYCAACDPDTQSAAAEWLQQCYEEQEQEKQTQAWEQYYEAHNGDMSNYANYMQGNGWGQGAGQWGGQQGNYYVNNQQQQQNAQYAQQQQQNQGNGQYYQGQYNGNAGGYNGNNGNQGNNGGQRKLSNYYNGAGAYSAYQQNNGGAQNGYNYNAQYGQNQNQDENGENGGDGTYGYYNEQGEWQEIDEDVKGYWGADGQFYEYENNDNSDYCLNMLMTDEELIEQYQCDDYVCGDYFTYCTDFYQGGDGDIDVREYMQCTQAPQGNYYIAPHCGSNHYTISLGVFADGNCAQYVGSDVSLSSVLGVYMDTSELEFFPKECVSCSGAVSKYMPKSAVFVCGCRLTRCFVHFLQSLARSGGLWQ